jgi:calcium binding protein 39
VQTLHALLLSENYVAKRQSLKVLGDLLGREREVLAAYLLSGDNLKIHMNLMRSKSKSIQYDSFMIFQVSFFTTY